MRSLLSDNMLNSLVMSGSKELEVKTSMSVSVDVKHIAAKIVLDKVTRDFTDPNLEEVPMRLKKIYVSNVAADCDYACSGGTPTIWNNQLGVLGTTPENAALLVDGGLDEDLGEGKTYSTAHTFYVYPNPVTADKTDNIWSPRKTRLVLECDYNGRTCYYPVTIPGENYDVGAGTSPDIQRNKVYHINALTLKRPGSQNTESKEPPVQSDVSCTFSVSVADWEDDIPYTEVF